MKKILLILLVFILFCISCETGKIHGSGYIASQGRSIPYFHSVKIKNSADLYFSVDSIQDLHVITDDNLISNITTNVDDNDRLYISNLESFYSDYGVDIVADMLEVRSLNIAGSGDIQSEAPFYSESLELIISGSGDIELDVTADDIDIDISGSGDIELIGDAGRMNIDIGGSGDIESRELITDVVTIDISGSGDCTVYASDTLYVDISGSGNVYFAGSAVVVSHISGSGHVEPLLMSN